MNLRTARLARLSQTARRPARWAAGHVVSAQAIADVPDVNRLGRGWSGGVPEDAGVGLAEGHFVRGDDEVKVAVEAGRFELAALLLRPAVRDHRKRRAAVERLQDGVGARKRQTAPAGAARNTSWPALGPGPSRP